ncbi:hypothetical protein FRC01_003151 [Tulasnella sp. 417]|nr:hypothetical protein FRC01_003151 [Tulasnella sp. 417]
MCCHGEPLGKRARRGSNAGQGAIHAPAYSTNTQPAVHPPLQYPDLTKTSHPPKVSTNGDGTKHRQMPSSHRTQTVNVDPGVVPTSSPPNDVGPTGYPPGPQVTIGHHGAPKNNFGPMLDPTIQELPPSQPPQRSTTVSPPLALDPPRPSTGPGSVTSSTPFGAGYPPPLQYPDLTTTPHPPKVSTKGDGTKHRQMPSSHRMQTSNVDPGVVPTSSPPNDVSPTGYPPGPQVTIGHHGAPQNNFGPMLDPTIQELPPSQPPRRSTTVSPPLAMDPPGPSTGPGSVTSSTPSGAAGSTFDDGKLNISVE